MVDGGWGGLQDPSITGIGCLLVFRAGALVASLDRGRWPTSVTITRKEVMPLSAAIEFERVVMARSRWKCA